MKNNYIGYFIIILLIAGYFRFVGVNWDQNQHLHPDERFLTMVATSLTWPTNLKEYFDTAASPVNPHNKGFDFYVYGTWPVLLVKAIAERVNMGTYDGVTTVGRIVSGVIELFIVLLVYSIGTRSTKNPSVGLIAAFIYACMTTPIQLSHFFAVDPYATLFLTVCLLLMVNKPRMITSFAVAFCFGIAIATKISSVIVTPVIFIWFIYHMMKKKNYLNSIVIGLLCVVIVYFSVRIFLPYLFQGPHLVSFKLNDALLANWKQLKSFEDRSGWFPPTVQWITTIPIVFPLWNMIWIGLGLPICLLLTVSIPQLWKHPNKTIVGLVVFICCLFGYQGIQLAKAIRYFYPVYPALAVLTGYGLWHIIALIPSKKRFLAVYIGTIIVLIWPWMVTSLYRTPHTRIVASEWIYNNIPLGSNLGEEHWDDGLPLSLPRKSQQSYTFIELPLYNQDDPAKWNLMEDKLQSIDYIVLSSNRLYASITSVPKKYPETTTYYQSLFDGSLGFEKVAEFTSRPSLPFPIPVCIPLPLFSYGTIAKAQCTDNGIQIIDDYVDETWTVYDHPKVVIFKKRLP